MSQIIKRTLSSDFLPPWIGFRHKNGCLSLGGVHNALVLNTGIVAKTIKCANVRQIKVIPIVNLNWSPYGYVVVWYAVWPTPNVKSCQSLEYHEIG